MRIRENVITSDYIEYWGDITSMLKELTGNVIDKAEFLLACKYDNDKRSEILQYAKEEGRKLEELFEKKKILDVSDNALDIRFITGKSIRITSSEYMLINPKE